MTGFGMYDTGWLVAAAVAGCAFVMMAPVGASMIRTARAIKMISPIPPIIGFVCFLNCLTLNVKDVLYINFTFDIFISFISFT